MRTKMYLLLPAFMIVLLQLHAQGFDWAVSVGSTGSDVSRGTAVDAAGSIYTTGTFTGTVDFDPGAGSYPLTASGSSNIYVQKVDASGNFVWARAMTGTDISRPYGIAVDANSNVYSTGFIAGTVDFDPGAGTLNLSSGSTIWRDYYVQKLDSMGNLVWAFDFGSGHEDIGYGIAVDAAGNLLVTGAFADTVDFDPGAGVTSLAAVNKDIFVQKLDPAGNLLWVKSMTTTIGFGGDDNGFGITSDASNNVLLTGTFAGEVDFDPGPGVAHLTNLDFDGFIEKLDASGNYVWARQLACTSLSEGYSLSTTSSGDVLVTGIFMDELDSDPGSAVANVVSHGGIDAYVMKLDAAGDLVWFNQIGGTGDDYGRVVTQDISGNIYIAGDFRDTVDFDASAGTALFYSAGNSDVFALRLDAAGAYQSMLQIGSTGNESAFGLVCDGGSVILSGYFQNTIDLDPFAGTSTHVSAGSEDAYIVKLDGGAVAVNEGRQHLPVTVYPNPSSGKVWVRTEGTSEILHITITNAAGVQLPEPVGGFTSELDLSAYPAGLYFLRILSEEGEAVIRIAKVE